MRTPSARQISNAAVATPPPIPQIEHPLALLHARARDEHPVGGLVDERERRRLLEREPVVEREHLLRGDRDQLACVPSQCSPTTVIASPCSSPGLSTTRSPDLEAVDAVPERLDDAGAVRAEDPRLRHGRKALAHPDVEVVERRDVRSRTSTSPGPATGSGTSS